MKQKKCGKKIINWHRPISPSHPRRRFRQHRHDVPIAWQEMKVFTDDFSIDNYWNCYDSYHGCGCCRREGDQEDLDRYELNKLLEEMFNPPLAPLFREGWGTNATVERKPQNVVSFDLQGQPVDTTLTQRLVEYLEEVVHCSQSSDWIRARINEATGNPKNLEIVKREAARLQAPVLAQRICLFAPFWLRRPDTWNQTSNETGLLEHLFVLHDVPAFLYSEWFREQEVLRFKWLCWFILLGQGGSLKRAGELFRWRVSGKFQHYLQDAPRSASPIEACLFAEVKRLGGSDRDFAFILRNPAFVIDPTEPSETESYETFWQETVRWLITHADAMTNEEGDLVLAWAMHEYTEAVRQGGQSFSWKGRRVRAVLERSVHYRRQVDRPWSSYRWNGHGWDWALDQASHGIWSFVELKSGQDLIEEGRAMSHCVASYAGRCASGYSAIVSMRHNNSRRVTVEINPTTRQIVQARGTSNRNATTEEREALSLWMTAVVQQNGSHQNY